MITIITDSREQSPLIFSQVKDVEYKTDCLPVGDYMAESDDIVIERKSMADLWTSYNAGYERERTKILKAKELGLKFILAIEGTCFDVRQGFSYRKDGEEIDSKVDGISMIRKLFTIMRKYDVPIWFCNGRKEMAFMIQELFLAKTRIKDKNENPK